MNITKAIGGLVSVMALTLVTAGASMAQISFSYTTTFSPNPIPTSGGFGNIIQVIPGANPVNTTPTAIQLDNFKEFSTVPPGSMVAVNQAFDIGLTITPAGGAPQTQHFLGTITGNFNTNQTFTNVNVALITPQPYTYNFGSLGSLTISNFNYDQPGAPSAATLGSLSAVVTGSTSTPEPATVVPFALGGLGLLGLIVRKTRRTGGAAA